jgi:hypothetical protein
VGQTEAREDANGLIVKGLYRGVIAGYESSGLFPHGALRGPPLWTVANLDLYEADRSKSPIEVDPPQMVGHPLVIPIVRLPTSHHNSATGRHDPAQLPVGQLGLFGELYGVNA